MICPPRDRSLYRSGVELGSAANRSGRLRGADLLGKAESLINGLGGRGFDHADHPSEYEMLTKEPDAGLITRPLKNGKLTVVAPATLGIV